MRHLSRLSKPAGTGNPLGITNPMGMAFLHFSAEDWERIERDTMVWWVSELERPWCT
jgi:hypothetical protein